MRKKRKKETTTAKHNGLSTVNGLQDSYLIRRLAVHTYGYSNIKALASPWTVSRPRVYSMTMCNTHKSKIYD